MGKRRGSIYSPCTKIKRLETSTESSESPGNQNRNILNEGLVNLYKQVLIEKDDKQIKSENTENLKTPAKEKKRRNNAPVASLSNFTFDDVGGMEDILEELRFIFCRYQMPLGVKKTVTRGILLHGPPGCGKTLIARALSGELGLPILEVGVSELVNGTSGESEGKIRDMFEAAIATGRCILFFDNLQVLSQKSSENNLMYRMGQQLSKCFDDLVMKDPDGQVMVVGATDKIEDMDTLLRCNGRFSRDVAIGIPVKSARQSILENILKDVPLQPDFSLQWLAKSTPGYVGGDLKDLVELAEDIGIRRLIKMSSSMQKEHENITEPEKITHSQPHVPKIVEEGRYWWGHFKDTPIELVKNFFFTEEDFKLAIKGCVPYGRKEGFAVVDNVTWDDVGALEDVKQTLQESIVWPIKYSELYQSNNMSTPKGILLFGPKGCGKTLVAKAIANECELNFLLVNGPNLLNMYVGESERAIRNTFQRAQNLAPCVIFFDEFDALCSARSNSKENAPVERVVNQLLCASDGACSRKEVYLVAATNRLDKIDSAMLRPGRLETVYYVGLPSPNGRIDILRNLARKTQINMNDEELESIALDPRCEDFSGADLASLVREATRIAMREKMVVMKGNIDNQANVELTHSHFYEALELVKPSITEQDKKYFAKHSSLCRGGNDLSRYILNQKDSKVQKKKVQVVHC